MGQKGRPSKLFTRAEREEAARNGVSYQTLNDRRYRGWTKEEAIQTPIGQPRRRWSQVAVENGINMHTYYTRVKRGMSEEDAATLGSMKRQQKDSIPHDDTPRQIKQAEGTAPLEVVAKQYGKSPEEVQTIWRYYA